MPCLQKFGDCLTSIVVLYFAKVVRCIPRGRLSLLCRIDWNKHMAIHFKIFENFNLVVSRWDGIIKTDDVIPSYKKLFEDEKWKPRFNEIIDLRNAGMHELKSEDLQQINKSIENYYEGIPINVAVIAPNDLSFGMARIYEVYAYDSSECVKVFRKVHDALNWIGMKDEEIVDYIQNNAGK